MKIPSFNLQLTEEEQRQIVEKCNTLKQGLVNQATERKERMQRGFYYYNSQFYGDDLIPRAEFKQGAERDVQQTSGDSYNRPNVFIPLVRQQIKALHSQLKLSLFPNDVDYCRILPKTERAKAATKGLSEAFNQVLEEMHFSEQCSDALKNGFWSGMALAYPRIMNRQRASWYFDEQTQKFEQVLTGGQPQLILEVFDPLRFYVEPQGTLLEEKRWVYCTSKKIEEMIQNPELYMNTQKLLDPGQGGTYGAYQRSQHTTHGANWLNQTYSDIEGHIDYDLYYFPYIRLEGKGEERGRLIRNVLIGIAGEQHLVRLSPNPQHGGLAPVVYTAWTYEQNNPYSISTAEEMFDQQMMINLFWNHIIDSLARCNVLAVADSVDLTNYTAGAGGILSVPDDLPINQAISQFVGNTDYLAFMLNAIGVLKAEGQMTSGHNATFQGSTNIDYKKTATEMMLLSETEKTLSSELVERIGNQFVQPLLQRILTMCLLNNYPVKVERRYETSEQPSTIEVVEMGQFLEFIDEIEVELTSVNTAQSKAAIANSLERFAQVALSQPELFSQLRDNGYHLMKKILEMVGVKNSNEFLLTPNEASQKRQQEMLEAALMQAQGRGPNAQ